MLLTRSYSRCLLSMFCVLAAAFVLGTSEPALAEDASYDDLVRNALSEYTAGRYEEAASLFTRAHALSPNARTHRGLGLTFFEARKYALAVPHLRAALTDTRRALTKEQLESTQKILTQAEGYVARVKIALTPSVASLEVDGAQRTLEGDELMLDAGRHELIARADGYQEDRRIVEIAAGAQLTLTISLVDASTAAPESSSAQPTVPAAAPAGATVTVEDGVSIAPFIVMGAGAAMLVGGVVTGVMASGLHSDLEDRCKTIDCNTDKSAQDDRDRGDTLVTLTNVLLIGGAVTAAAGTVWWLLTDSADADSPVTASCSFDGCAAALQGNF